MTERFRDSRETIFQFTDEVLVRCPRCARRALVRSNFQPGGWQVRLVCPSCGLTREHFTSVWGPKPGLDPFFFEPLWLQTPCCGEVLWAYNERHLLYVEAFVAAKLRQRPRDPDTPGSRNQTLVSRLPAWIKQAKNRTEVLRCIERLKALL